MNKKSEYAYKSIGEVVKILNLKSKNNKSFIPIPGIGLHAVTTE